MVFILVGVLLILFSYIEIKNEHLGVCLFNISCLILMLLLCFRYGQGTDYISYYDQYMNITEFDTITNNTLFHGEYGWYVLMYLFKKANLSFDIFMAIISFVLIACFWLFIYKYSKLKNLSLLLLYPTYYLTYSFSAIRQALALGLFLSISIGLLIDKKYIKYIISILAICFIHKAAIVLAFLPIIVNIKFNSNRRKEQILKLIV